MNVKIEGHTDSRGSLVYNENLSNARAQSVYKSLLGHGVKQKRLSYEGFGETRPVADNKTVEGRAENRRIEFKVSVNNK